MFPSLTPYMLLIKIGAAIALLAGVFFYGHHMGAKSVQADWDISIAHQQEATITLMADNAKHVADIVAQNNLKNVEVSNEHQQKVDKLEKDLAAARANIKSNGGLHYSIPNEGSGVAGSPEAPSDSGHDADIARVGTLPDDITENLLSLTSEADKVTETARACQNWVRVNGFYDDMTAATKEKGEEPVKDSSPKDDVE